jgi:hypothetical protein
MFCESLGKGTGCVRGRCITSSASYLWVDCSKSCFYLLASLRFKKISQQKGSYLIMLKPNNSKVKKKVCLRFKKSLPQ